MKKNNYIIYNNKLYIIIKMSWKEISLNFNVPKPLDSLRFQNLVLDGYLSVDLISGGSVNFDSLTFNSETGINSNIENSNIQTLTGINSNIENLSVNTITGNTSYITNEYVDNILTNSITGINSSFINSDLVNINSSNISGININTINLQSNLNTGNNDFTNYISTLDITGINSSFINADLTNIFYTNSTGQNENVNNINVSNITGNNAFFQYLFFHSATGQIDTFTGSSVVFMTVDVMTGNQISATGLSWYLATGQNEFILNSNITNLTGTNSTLTNISNSYFSGTNIFVTNLNATNITGLNITFNTGVFTNLVTTNFLFTNETGTNSDLINIKNTNFSGSQAFIPFINSTTITGTNSFITNISNSYFSGTDIFVTNLNAGTITGLNITFNTGVFTNLQTTNFLFTNETGTNSHITNLSVSNVTGSGKSYWGNDMTITGTNSLYCNNIVGLNNVFFPSITFAGYQTAISSGGQTGTIYLGLNNELIKTQNAGANSVTVDNGFGNMSLNNPTGILTSPNGNITNINTTTITGVNGLFTNLKITNFTGTITNLTATNILNTNVFTGNIVYSAHNTLDDGHGNMIITPNSETALTINYTGNDYSYIRFNQGTTTQLGKIGFSNNVGIGFNVQNWTGTNILYQPADHSLGIRTLNNILDDGNGFMTLNGNSTYAFPLTINSSSTSVDTVGIILSNTNTTSGLAIKWDSSNGIQIYDTKNANIWLRQGNTNTGSVQTLNNTLDDGHGNIYGNQDNTFLSWDDASNRFGLVKKSGLVGAISSAGANNIIFNNYTTGTVTNFTSALISQVTPNTVFTIGYSGIVSSLHNTLDNGFGSMTINFTGISSNNCLTVNGNNRASSVFIVENNGTVGTISNTLDDGTGSLFVNGNSTNAFPFQITSQSTSSDTVGMIMSNTNLTSGLTLKWDSSNGIQIVDTKNNNVWLRQGNTNTGSVQTLNNTLDNGFGAQQFKTITISSHATTISTPVSSVYFLEATGTVLPTVASVGVGVPLILISEVLGQTITCSGSDVFYPSGSATISVNSNAVLHIISQINLLNNGWYIISRNST